MDLFWDTYQAYLRSYLPQWRYAAAGGEPESAVLRATVELIEASRARMADLPQKHELAFLAGWELEPLEADPVYACAALTAPEGTPVPAGTEFYISGDGAQLWRTAEDAQAEPARLTEQFLTGRGKQILLPLPDLEQPVRLFDFRREGLPGPELQFSHPDAFSSQGGCQIELTLPQQSSNLLELIGGGEEVRWSLVCASGDAAAQAFPVKTEKSLRFQLPAAPDGCALRVSLPAFDLPAEVAGAVTVRTERREQPPALIWDGDIPLSGARCLPFGPIPEPWRVCYFSCPDALALRGAWLTVSFALSFQEYEEQLPGMDKCPEYRPIMRRLPPVPPVHEVRADQVLWEYWNGRMWLPIPGTEEFTGSFAAAGQGTARVEARFLWPADAVSCEVGGQTGLWLRWRVGRAGNGGWLPRRCYAPEITDFRFSALLEHAPVSVSLRVRPKDRFCPLSDPRFALLQTDIPKGDCWWLGFDRPPSGPLLRMYLALQSRLPGGALTAWEAEEGGNRPLTLRDGTDGLSHSGMITINGVQGGMVIRFGLRRWWLCLKDDSGQLSQGRRFPCLEELSCGAVRLQGASGERCRKGEPLAPLRGGTLRAVTLTESFGGSAGEDRADFLRRARGIRHHQGRCVSALDVEQLICGRLRDVLRTRCLRKAEVLHIAVLMRDIRRHEEAFANRREEIRQLLERDSVLPTLGLEIAVQEPVFYPINAMVWLRTAEEIPLEAIRGRVCEALDRFLDPAAGRFQGEGWPIGRLPAEIEARNFLQDKLPGLVIARCPLTAVAPDGRELDCAQISAPFSLPVPGAYTVHVLRGEGQSCMP